jgi:hypothetical protein
MHKRSPLAAYLVLLAVAVSIAAILLGLARTPGLYGFARGAALVGYQFVLLAVVSSAFVKPLVRTYHKPFIKLHHWVSVSGLALLMVHPILLVIATGKPALLIAAYTTDFFRYAGSPALTLLLIAAAAAVLRTRVAKVCRPDTGCDPRHSGRFQRGNASLGTLASGGVRHRRRRSLCVQTPGQSVGACSLAQATVAIRTAKRESRPVSRKGGALGAI